MTGRLERKHLLLMALAAMLAGWLAGPAPDLTQPLVQARRDAWQLLSLPVLKDDSNVALQLAGATMWGPENKSVPDTAPTANMRWRLAGVYGAGKVGGALVLFEDESKPAQRLKVGEKLPSGHVIEAVDGNQICVRIQKKLYRFGVELRD